MSSRLRSLDSKISFFAFADIITAVSGVLIFVALLLATDLGQPTDPRSQAANSEMEQRLQETLSQQAEVDAQNQHLQGLLAAAETAPAAEKLETDITRLRAQLAAEKKQHASVAEQLAASQSATEARDRTLGLTDLKAQIERVVQEAESLARQEAKVREEMTTLEQRVTGMQSKLLKLREREGKLWLIPDKSSTTKEPILATISGSSAKVERFDHPSQAKEFSKSSARTEFNSYLGEAKPLDQYVVFLVRPSGIELFERLVKLAREKGFEVGFDALEEDREIHFSTPPPLDETPVPNKTSDTATSAKPSASSTVNPAQTNSTPTATPAAKPISQPAAASKPPPSPKTKSWWQRLLELIGLA
jgi:myosin heavy subunit